MLKKAAAEWKKKQQSQALGLYVFYIGKFMVYITLFRLTRCIKIKVLTLFSCIYAAEGIYYSLVMRSNTQKFKSASERFEKYFAIELFHLMSGASLNRYGF